jgi:hypothetical protein
MIKGTFEHTHHIIRNGRSWWFSAISVGDIAQDFTDIQRPDFI